MRLHLRPLLGGLILTAAVGLGREARSMRVVGGRAHGTSAARVEPAAVRTPSTSGAS